MMRPMLILLLTLACAPSPPAAPPESAASASAETTRTLTLDPRYLSWDEAAGTVTFSPGSDMQAAEYTDYVLDLRSVEAALGGRPESPVAVQVALDAGQTRTVVPDDPNLPQPMGGFQFTTFTGRVIGLAPADGGAR